MSLEMTHDDVRAALAAEALGALDGPEREQVRAHLAGCAECRAELDSLQEAAGALAFAAPYRAMEPARAGRLRARLVARAAADRPAAPEGSDGQSGQGYPVGFAPAPAPPAEERRPDVIPITAARSRRFNAGWLAAAASVLLLIGVGAYALSLQGRVDALASRAESLEAERVRLAAERGRLERSLADRERLILALAEPTVRVINLAGSQERDPSGRMFWDPKSGTWTFFAHHMPALRQGREYQLWILTPEKAIDAGTFRVDPTGHAEHQAKYELPPEAVQGIAVTEEPAGGVPVATGPIVIVGKTE